jgi:Ca2+-binding RTX toxin-like protein
MELINNGNATSTSDTFPIVVSDQKVLNDFNDFLKDTSDSDTLLGSPNNGNDDRNGTSDSDTLLGNTSPNRIGNDFSELMVGTADNNEFLGRAGNDTLMGFAGFDILMGELGDDSLLGGDDADLLDGGDGNDFLAGDKGNDTMIGGSGNDRFQWVDGDGNDLIGGGDGIDELIFNGSATQGDRINLSQSGSDIVLQRTNLVPATLTIQGIERFNAINGGGGDDELTLSNLDAASGVEFIKFTGGDGNDRLTTNNTSANIDASGGNSNDILVSSNGNDTLLGDRGNDIISGGFGNDRIIGAESGNLGRGEIDTLTGGPGQDTFVLNNFYDDGNAFIDGDVINFWQGIDGTGDFARILDFIVGEDVIQLSGPRSSYQLKPIINSLQGGRATQDLGIFKNTGFAQPLELIAIVQDAPSGLNLNNTTQFTFS